MQTDRFPLGMLRASVATHVITGLTATAGYAFYNNYDPASNLMIGFGFTLIVLGLGTGWSHTSNLTHLGPHSYVRSDLVHQARSLTRTQTQYVAPHP